MRLSKDDRYEFARAALMAPDLQSLRNYIVQVIDTFEGRPEGKTEIQCPRFTEPGSNGHAPKQASGSSEDGTLL